MAEPTAAEEEIQKIYQAVRLGKNQAVKDALASGAITVEYTDAKGDTLLHVAARNGHKSIVKELLRKKADGTLQNLAGKTPYDLALDFNYPEVCNYIREKFNLPPLDPALAHPENTSDTLASLPPPQSAQPDAAAAAAAADAAGADEQRSASRASAHAGTTPPPGDGDDGDKAPSRRRKKETSREGGLDVLLQAIELGDAADPQGKAAVEMIRDRLGDARRAKQLEELVTVFWKRLPLFLVPPTGGACAPDLDSNVRLQREITLLRTKMGPGADIEVLIDSSAQSERRRQELERELEAARARLKESTSVQDRISEITSRLEEAERTAEEAVRSRDSALARLEDVSRDLEAHDEQAQASKDKAEATRKELSRLRSALSQIEVESEVLGEDAVGEIYLRHQVDGSLDPEAIGPFVQDLVSALEKEVHAAREAVDRERAAGGRIQRGWDADKEAWRDREAGLLERISESQAAVEQWEARLREQREEMQRAQSKAVAVYEQQLERVQQDADSQVAKAKRDCEARIGRMEAELKEQLGRAQREAADELDLTRRRADAAEAEARVLQEGLGDLASQLQHWQAAAAEARRDADRLAHEVRASRSIATLRALGGLRRRLLETRQALGRTRAEVAGLATESAGVFGEALSEIKAYCTFLLPLPFERPEAVRTDRLTPAQLAGGLRLMMGKYRGAAAQCRALNVELQALRGSMRVYCRVRPLGEAEAHEGGTVHIRGMGILSVMDSTGPKDYQFDQVYGPKSSQADVFEDARALLQTVADGYNVSLFAYGPTGSGKTLTLLGDNRAGSDGRGITYRALEEVFAMHRERAVTDTLDVMLSMFEIYNEQIRDLLPSDDGSRRDGLKVTHDRRGAVVIEGLSEHRIDSYHKGSQVVDLGLRARVVGATKVNERSSRSHLIIRVTIRSTDKQDGTRKVGKLYMIDLAGSENVGHSGAEGQLLKEAIGINRSLSALHDVLISLASKETHVPYRNSTLTQVLQDSLGGQAKVLMYVMISPSARDLKMAQAALKFAGRCKSIVLAPAGGGGRPNVDRSEADECRAELERCRAEVDAARRALHELGEKLDTSVKDLAESERFETKLRELFGFANPARRRPGPARDRRKHRPAGGGGPPGKKGADRTEASAAGAVVVTSPIQENGEGGGGGTEPKRYLDDKARLLVYRQQVHDELLYKIRVEVTNLALACRDADSRAARLEAEVATLAPAPAGLPPGEGVHRPTGAAGGGGPVASLIWREFDRRAQRRRRIFAAEEAAQHRAGPASLRLPGSPTAGGDAAAPSAAGTTAAVALAGRPAGGGWETKGQFQPEPPGPGVPERRWASGGAADEAAERTRRGAAKAAAGATPGRDGRAASVPTAGVKPATVRLPNIEGGLG